MKKILSVILAAGLALGGLGVNKVGAYEMYSTTAIYNQAINEHGGPLDVITCYGLERDIYDDYGAQGYKIYDYTQSNPNRNVPEYGYVDKTGNTQYIMSSGRSIFSEGVSVNVQYIYVQYHAVTTHNFSNELTLGIHDDGLWHRRCLGTIDGTHFWICGKSSMGIMDATSSTPFPGLEVIDNPHNSGAFMYWGTSLKRIYKSLRELVADDHLAAFKTTSDASYTYILNEDYTIKEEKKYTQYASTTHAYSLSARTNPSYRPENFSNNNLVYLNVGGHINDGTANTGHAWFVRYNDWNHYYY